MTASTIEALPSTRLYELWLEQKMLNDKVAVRAGQLAADTEFLVSSMRPASTDPVGHAEHRRRPAERRTRIPLATQRAPKSRRPTRSRSWLPSSTAIRPARRGSSPIPIRNSATPTVDFRTKDPAFLIGEAAWAYNQGKDAASLPGTIKLGGWAHLGRRFQDQRSDNIGLSLAEPETASPGASAAMPGSTAFWTNDLRCRQTDQGLGVFARVAGSPATGT